MEEYMIWIWLGIFVVALIAEAMTTDLVSIWFAAGSVIALILSAIPGVPFWVEIIVFFVISTALLLLIRPITKKYLLRNEVKSNIDEIVGKKATVIKEITELQMGEVKVNGVTWNAISSNKSKETIAVGKTVVVVAVDGNKLVVED